MNKKIFALLLLMFALIYVSTVSAADNNATFSLDDSSDVIALSDNNSDVLGISENQDILQISDSDDVLGTGSYFYKFDCPYSINVGENKKVSFSLMGEPGTKINNEIVWLYVDGQKYEDPVVTDAEGEGSFRLGRLAIGTHELQCKYGGSSQWDSCESPTKEIIVTEGMRECYLQNTNNIDNLTMDEGDQINFYVSVFGDPDHMAPEMDINLKLIARHTVINATVNSAGIASFDLSAVPAGNYAVRVVVDDENYISGDVIEFALKVNGNAKTLVYLAGDDSVSINQGQWFQYVAYAYLGPPTYQSC